jgi:hypothetical protein
LPTRLRFGDFGLVLHIDVRRGSSARGEEGFDELNRGSNSPFL